jgi:hypothetical protein
MEDAVRGGKHQKLWDVMLDSAEKTINDEEIQRQIVHRVDEAIHELKEKDFLKKAFLGIAEFLGVLQKDVIAGKIIEDLCIIPNPCLWDVFLVFSPLMVRYSVPDCYHARSLFSPFSLSSQCLDTPLLMSQSSSLPF